MDSSLKVTTAQGAVNNELIKKGLVIKRNEAGQLVITDKDGNPAYNDSHEKISDTNSFIDGVLAQNKLLKINDANQQSNQNSNASNGANFIPGNNPNQNQGNAAIVAEMDAQLAGMK